MVKKPVRAEGASETSSIQHNDVVAKLHHIGIYTVGGSSPAVFLVIVSDVFTQRQLQQRYSRYLTAHLKPYIYPITFEVIIFQSHDAVASDSQAKHEYPLFSTVFICPIPPRPNCLIYSMSLWSA